MKKKTLLMVLFLTIVLGGMSLGGYYVYNRDINTDAIYSGVSIEGFYVGELTPSEALKYIQESREKQLEESFMTLNYGDYSYDIGLKDIDYNYDYAQGVEKAYEVGRQGKLFERYKKIKEVREDGVIIPLESSYNVEKIKDLVKEISEDIYIASKDAVFKFNGGNISIEDESVGREVDDELLTKSIEANIEDLRNMEIPVLAIEPGYTKEYYSRINGVIGQYSTNYANSALGRKKNIQVSAGALNGKMLHPGESISYNEITGPKQRQFGYEEAPVIVNGELTPGMGGGVCQTSTTLYNALLLADLTILERHPHSIPPTYINKGQDAAVANGYLDLKFRNDFEYPIYISSWASGDRVSFSIYGDKANRDYIVRIQPEIIESIPYKVVEKKDENAEPGLREIIEQGRNGYKVRTFKSIIRNGKVAESKQITRDYYREKDFIYKLGPEKIVVEEEVKPEAEAIEEEAKSEDPIVETP